MEIALALALLLGHSQKCENFENLDHFLDEWEVSMGACTLSYDRTAFPLSNPSMQFSNPAP